MTAAIAWEGDTGEWLPLVKVAEELGVTRSAVYLMVVDGRLDGMQCGARWHVRRYEVERFRSRWQPAPNAGRRLPRRSSDPSGPELVLRLLQDWGDASSDELAEALGRHPGNIRKYLKLLAVRGQVIRRCDGSWTTAHAT